jgi:hypothetical protein
MIINKICETQNLLSLWLVSLLVGLYTYHHPCICAYHLAVVLKEAWWLVFWSGSLPLFQTKGILTASRPVVGLTEDRCTRQTFALDRLTARAEVRNVICHLNNQMVNFFRRGILKVALVSTGSLEFLPSCDHPITDKRTDFLQGLKMSGAFPTPHSLPLCEPMIKLLHVEWHGVRISVCPE